MACHVSTCMAHLKAIYGAVCTSKEGQEGRGREKRKGGKEKRKKKNEEERKVREERERGKGRSVTQ